MELLIFVVIIIWAIWAASSGGTSKGKSARKPQRKKRSDRGSSFEISVKTNYRRQRKLSSKEAYQESRKAWVPPGERTVVSGRAVPDGMIYVGSKLRQLTWSHSQDPALINPALDAQAKRSDKSGQHLDYYPSYTDIPRSSRAAYLDWLSSGRRSTDYDIGYVFLFYYGLERRILIDAKHGEEVASEIPTLLEEIEALRSVYTDDNRSFDRYSRELLTYARLAFDLYGDETSTPSDLSNSHRRDFTPDELITLGRLIRNREPIPPEWALLWVRNHLNMRLRTPGKRCVDEFNQLFLKRYSERFGSGLVYDSNYQPLRIEYRPATSSIRETQTYEKETLADPNTTRYPRELRELVEGVEEDLDAYSRWIGRRDDRDSLAAIGHLPREILRQNTGDNARTFIEEIEKRLGEKDRVVVKSEWLVGRWPSKNEEYFTKTEAEALSRLLAGFDLGVEPDVRYTRNPSKREHVAIFRLKGEDVEPGESFRAARLLVHLAAAVASADDDPSEQRYIEEHLEDALELSPSERARLKAYLERCLHAPPSMRGVRRRAEKLPQQVRRQLATFLLTVAAADGHIDASEIQVLEKIYNMLGMRKELVHKDLHKMSARGQTRSDRGPVTVIEADAQESYLIPEGEDSEVASAERGFHLDTDRIASIQDETRDVARVLEDIFSDDEDDEEETLPTLSTDGLDEDYEALLTELIARAQWPRSDFDELAEKHGLMPAFAIEQINEMAFELADEPLLEGEDPVELNPYALEILQS